MGNQVMVCGNNFEQGSNLKWRNPMKVIVNVNIKKTGGTGHSRWKIKLKLK